MSNEVVHYHDVSVKVVPNGFIIRVGCTEIVATDPRAIIGLAEDYYSDPEGTMRNFLKRDKDFRMNSVPQNPTPRSVVGGYRETPEPM